MESFAIVCETCRARLKVRSAKVVGEIHACPKCGSMVQILPPAGAPIEATSSIALQADSVAMPAAESIAPAMEIVEPQLPPVALGATTSPVFLWSAGAAVALLVGIAAVAWTGGKSANETPVRTASVENAKAAAEEPNVRDPYAVSSVSDAADEPAKPDEHSVDPLAQTQADDRPAPALPALPAEGPKEGIGKVEAAQMAVVEPAVAPEMVETQEATALPAIKPRPAGVLKFDPLDFDPNRLSLNPRVVPAAAGAPGSIADNPADDDLLARQEPSRESATDVSLPPPDRERTLQVRLGPMPNVVRITSAERLALRVDSLNLSDVPLVRFVDILSDMAGVAVTIDPVVLELAGVSPLAAVSVQANDTTIERLLGDALSPHGLVLVEREGAPVIALNGGEHWRSVEHEVKDLVRGADAKEIANLIKRFVAPGTWQQPGSKEIVAVDGTKLRIKQAESVHREIVVFCERLRLARGLAFRSRYPSEGISIVSAWDATRTKLAKRTTFTFLPWTPLADVLRHWSDSSGLTILGDWSALAEAGLAPSSPISCSAIDRSWVKALDGILKPLGLAWWPVDGETIQITRPDQLDEILRVEFYEVPQSLRDQFAGDEALLESLGDDLRERTDAAQLASKAISWKLDAPSGRLIVLAPPTVHRHLSQRLRERAE
jgi:hypothetical protein